MQTEVKTLLLSSITFQDLIGLLERFLTSDDEASRHRATLLLADLLAVIPRSALSFDGAVLHLLVVFFCRRLGDYPSVIPALAALNCLITKHAEGLDSKYCDVAEAYHSLFSELNDVQDMVQSIRQKAFELLDSLLDLTVSHSAERSESPRQKIGAEVLSGIVASIEGERDPRCLLLCLRLIRKALEVFAGDIDQEASTSIFAAVSVYFPITFTPPADDEFGITAEALIESLEDCLCIHPQLEGSALPLFFENITGETEVGRVAALSAIVRLSRARGLSVLQRRLPASGEMYIKVLGQKLFDVITSLDPPSSPAGAGGGDVQAGLRAVTEVCALMGSAVAANGSSEWRLFAEPLLQSAAMELMSSVEGLQAQTSALIAFAVARASPLCLQAVADRLLPILLPRVQGAVNSIRSVLGSSLKSSRLGIRYLPPLLAGSANSTAIAPAPFLLLGQLVGVSAAGPTTPDLSQQDMQGHPSAGHAMGIFEVLFSLFEQLPIHVTPEPGIAPVPVNIAADVTGAISQVIACLKELLCKCAPGQLQAMNLEKLFETLTDMTIYGVEALWIHSCGSLGVTGPDCEAVATAAMHLIAVMAAAPDYERFVRGSCVGRLLAYEETASATAAQTVHSTLSRLSRKSTGTSTMTLALPCLLAASLLPDGAVALRAIADMLPEEGLYSTGWAAGAEDSARALYLCCAGDAGADSPIDKLISSAATEPCRLKAVCAIIRRAVLAMQATEQAGAVVYMAGRVAAHAEDARCKVLSSLFCYADYKSGLFAEHNRAFIAGVLEIAMATFGSAAGREDRDRVVDSAHLIASIVNKLPAGATLDDAVEGACNAFAASADSATALLLIWVAKAVMMRPDVDSVSGCCWQERLANQLVDTVLRPNAPARETISRLFSLLTREHPSTLSSRSRGVTSPVWRQRLWSRVFSQISAGSSSSKRFCLLALSGLATSMHSSIIASAQGQLVAAAVTGLSLSSSSGDAALRQHSLELVLVLLRLCPAELAPHSNSIAPVLVSVCAQVDASLKARVMALQCLLLMPAMPYTKLHPLVPLVVKGLYTVLDDDRRSIRSLAARVRNEWLVLK